MSTHSRWLLAGLLLAGCTKAAGPSFQVGADGMLVAPALGTVTVTSNLDSAVLEIPRIPGARDYRAFVFSNGAVSHVDSAGGQQIDGAVIYCAGLRQHSAPASPDAEPMQKIEVTDLHGPTTFVVEALDRPCPFPGVLGRTHVDTSYGTADPTLTGNWTIYTEDEIRARYGSLIVNGQGPGAFAGQAAPSSPPRVIARSTVTASPLANPAPRTSTFFDDFSAGDQPVFVANLPDATDGRQGFFGRLFQNKSWSFYSELGDVGTQVFVDRGQLHTILPDWSQQPMSSLIAFPRQPVQLPALSAAATYLHVTYEVGSDSTGRRYWWISLCGAQQPGQTLDAQGKLTALFVQTPFFYNPDGRNPSLAHWNCLQIFPRGGTRTLVPPTYTPVESDVRVMVNKPGVDPSVVNVSPDQLHDPNSPPNWYRQQGSSGLIAAALLDDQVRIAPRTRFDLYIRRDRVAMFVDGQQRLCNDFPNAALTMAEGALGFGHVLYHSSEERKELQPTATGQLQYLNNTPFVDERIWDNLGYDENVAPPANFDATACYVAR